MSSVSHGKIARAGPKTCARVASLFECIRVQMSEISREQVQMSTKKSEFHSAELGEDKSPKSKQAMIAGTVIHNHHIIEKRRQARTLSSILQVIFSFFIHKCSAKM